MSAAMNGYRSPLLATPGAVAVENGPDLGVAEHYGDPLREQRRLASGQGFVDLSHRAVVRVSGKDRLSWLHNLTTQRLDALTAGASAEALILSPQGHVEHQLMLVDDGAATWFHLEAADAQPLVTFLSSMRFMLAVEVDDVTADWAVVWEPLQQPHVTLLTRIDVQADAVAGRQVFVPRSELTRFAQSDDRSGGVAGVSALEALRVAAGRPRFSFETDHRTIPHELGWVGVAVQLDKGCYRGQETVARVANLGRPPRRLVRLHLDGSARETPPARSTQITSAGATIGRITTAAYHYEAGPIALAVIKYSTPDDDQVTVGDGEHAVAAAIEPIVQLDDGPRPGQQARAAFRVR